MKHTHTATCSAMPLEHRVKKTSVFCLASLIGITALVSGCTSAPHTFHDEKVSSDWKGKVYNKLLILGIYTDRPYRIGAEALFAEVLKGKGINASPSYDLLPRIDSLESNKDVARKLKETDYEGVLAVATIDEGYDYDLGDYYGTKGMFSLLGFRTGRFYEMGSFIDWAGSGIYSLYVGLYDVNSLRPVWKTTTDSETTGSESEDTKALAELVVNRLRDKGILEKPTEPE